MGGWGGGATCFAARRLTAKGYNHNNGEILTHHSYLFCLSALGVVFVNVSKHIKGLRERLYIMTQTHSLQIFGVIPFVMPQNDT